jgi:hypothetical protein
LSAVTRFDSHPWFPHASSFTAASISVTNSSRIALGTAADRTARTNSSEETPRVRESRHACTSSSGSVDPEMTTAAGVGADLTSVEIGTLVIARRSCLGSKKKKKATGFESVERTQERQN